MRPRLAAFFAMLLAGCAIEHGLHGLEQRVTNMLPADTLLVGEQHDAPEHHQVHRQLVEMLAARGTLAAMALEMAPDGGSTAGLPRDATERAVRTALRWNEAAWPWSAYGPAVMAAVQAGVPVVGANLPPTGFRAAMTDPKLDALLPAPALKAQQQAIRAGHCGLLPESQIAPMTRIQIARDRSMAQALVKAAVPGKTVLLIAGAAHVDRSLGVPVHLPAGTSTKVLALQAMPEEGKAGRSIAADTAWTTAAPPPRDYCAEMRQRLPGA